MRKLIVSVIAVLYFGVSSGMVVTFHQCMGKLSSVSLGEKEKPCKCSAKAKKKMPCCKSHSQLVKVQSEHQLSESAAIAFLSLPAEAPSFHIIGERFQTNGEIIYTNVHSPPLLHPKLYLKNRVFRI